MTKAKAKKSVVVAPKPPGRLIDKVAIENGGLSIEGGQAAKDAVDRALATSSPDFISYGLSQLANILKTDGSIDLTVEMNAAVAMLHPRR